MPRSFLALGDSYTIGQGVAAADRWPERLAALLGARGVVLSPPRVIARTGWTTADLARALAAERPAGPFDLVSLMVGVNDQFRGEELAGYERRFGALLGEAVALAGGDARRVLVLSIPDYGVTPFARGLGLDPRAVVAEVDRFNDAARLAARRAGARWVDVTPASRRAAAAAELLARDGLHPSAKLHAEWAALALPAALAALGDGPPVR
ncbi:MAG TPA: GDSL-type esterase/lipase family protein [Thermoanaerobaculia bacterium]|nr:GDSL-type esterase/lipase family protein [Thermoanaerobaculia bacterium]